MQTSYLIFNLRKTEQISKCEGNDLTLHVLLSNIFRSVTEIHNVCRLDYKSGKETYTTGRN